MALVVNTNIASMTAQFHAGNSRKEMETAMERLSSGLRINNAGDDAAGLTISTRMEAQIRGLAKGIQNANDAISLVQTAEGAQVEITDMLQRMRELAVQAANSTNSDLDRSALDAEVQALLAEIDQIANETEFNGQNILAGGFETNVQMGPSRGYELSFNIASMRADDLGVSGATGGNANATTGQRVNLTNVAAILDGDIEINGQKVNGLSDLVSGTDDISDIVDAINDSVEGVTASAYNTLVMQHVGSGIVDDSGAVTIDVGLTNSITGTAAGTATFTLDESGSMSELVANINSQTQGLVTASINSEGKLVLANTTGGSIEVTDATDATGTGDGTGVAYQGFIKLTSDDGNPVNIQKGYTATATDADFTVLGMLQTGKDDNLAKQNQILGKALTDVTTEYGKGDILINGVDIYDADIDTDTFAGKLEAFNAVSDETGVIASAYFEEFYDVSTAIANGTTAASTVTFNGIDIDMAATVSTLVTNINASTGTTGIAADYVGTTVRLFGAVESLTIAYTATFSDDEPFANGQTYGGILLDSVDDTAISIDLGENATVAEHGLLAMNAGASDYDTNAATTAAGGGSAVSAVSVSSVTGAQSAIEIIDNALNQVSQASANLGAVSNRLGHAVANMQETAVNTEAARSRIMDADFAVESANLAKQQVLQQASTAMLAQANAATQSVLMLLGG